MHRNIVSVKAADIRHMLLASMILVALMLVAESCQNDDEWNEMPQEIADFVSKYFPGEGIDSYSRNEDSYHVRIDDGPGITFGIDYAWDIVDGYGMSLPQMMLFDQLPPKVYAYLQDSRQLDSVFGMERDDRRYTLSLFNSTLFYDIKTGEIRGTVPTA